MTVATATTDRAVTIDADEKRISVTAVGDAGEEVGVAWCDATSSVHPHAAEVHVSPDERRRGTGTLLLRRLVDAASARGLDMLTWTHPVGDEAVDALTAASGAVCARRVRNGVVKTIVFVPVTVTS
ncbi:MAG: hypothetical protein QOD30_7 [Actinomycetota bacterium]|jgi:GNAT superfamily N-acetyltransferase|nr:hypothetical protein [Actinomycetota bacterium]